MADEVMGEAASEPVDAPVVQAAPLQLADLLFQFGLSDEVVPAGEKAALRQRIVAHIEANGAC
jgi:hypothetical protein